MGVGERGFRLDRVRGPKPAAVVRKQCFRNCVDSHSTTVDIHEAMQILFYLASFLVVGRPQALTFLDSSPDTEQGQRQVTGQDLAWKIQQI